MTSGADPSTCSKWPRSATSGTVDWYITLGIKQRLVCLPAIREKEVAGRGDLR